MGLGSSYKCHRSPLLINTNQRSLSPASLASLPAVAERPLPRLCRIAVFSVQTHLPPMLRRVGNRTLSFENVDLRGIMVHIRNGIISGIPRGNCDANQTLA